MEIILYILLFAFGWVSCLLFYFGKSVNFFYHMIKISQLLSLFILARALEHFTYAKEFRVKTMIKNNDSEHNIDCTMNQFEEEITFFKRSSLKELKEIMTRSADTKNNFSDWDSAMVYLANNTEFILTFMKKHKGES
jgi:hypothetical protein|tara:strand:- start:10440 stop:10850 length:411 start_codon:yes stop_codon:yes gene_type:complete